MSRPAAAGAAKPWSRIVTVEANLSELVAKAGLTPQLAPEVEALIHNAAAAGSLTYDLDKRNSLRDIVQYWSGFLSVIEGRTRDCPTVSAYVTDEAGEEAELALTLLDPGTFRDRVRKSRPAIECHIRGSRIQGSGGRRVQSRDAQVKNCRMTQGVWSRVAFTGTSEWSDTRFESFEFDGVVVDDLNAGGTYFEEVVFKACEFDTAEFDLAVFVSSVTGTQTSFQGASFRRASFIDQVASLDDDARVPFDLANKPPIRFEGCSFVDAKFHRATLCGVSFTGCDLSGAEFTHATLDGVDFRGATVTGADFRGIKHMPVWDFGPSLPEDAKIDPLMQALYAGGNESSPDGRRVESR